MGLHTLYVEKNWIRVVACSINGVGDVEVFYTIDGRDTELLITLYAFPTPILSPNQYQKKTEFVRLV